MTISTTQSSVTQLGSWTFALSQTPLSIQAQTPLPVTNDPSGTALSVTLTASDINNIVNPVTIAGSVPVTGAFWQPVQPVSAPAPLPVTVSGLTVTSPLPVQLSDGVQVSDLASLLKVIAAINTMRLQVAANQFGTAGFIPLEIPSFLGA